MPLSAEEVLAVRVNLALKLKGVTLLAIAKQIKRDQSYVYRVVDGSRNSPEVWEAIRKECGFDPRKTANAELKGLCRQLMFEEAA